MTDSPLLNRLLELFPEDLIETHSFRGDLTAVIRPEGLVRIVKCLRADPDFQFNVLMDLTAVDLLQKKSCFEVVYHFYSIPKNHRLRLKVPVPEKAAEVDSLVGEYAAADWYEREVYDMFGIRFRNHPNLRRILMYEGFEGHPLRKDYPIRKRQPIIGPMN